MLIACGCFVVDVRVGVVCLLFAGCWVVVDCVSCGFVGYLDCVAVGVCADLFMWLGDGCVGC